MIDIRQFESIKKKHSAYASWAVWAGASDEPKSNIGNIDHFKSKSVLPRLRNDVVMVGVNISRPLSEPFRNVHGLHSGANDFKIRYAFTGSVYYGAYMTDIIKFFREVDSKKVMEKLRKRRDISEQNVRLFQEEMKDLQATAPVILAFGGKHVQTIKRTLAKECLREAD